jgi:hypothetical protein
MAKRVEDGALVLWRPGFSVWLNVFGEGPKKTSRAKRYAELKAEASSYEGKIVRDKPNEPVGLIAVRAVDGHAEAVNAFAVSDSEYVQLGIYFDDAADEAKALALTESVRFAAA